MIRTLRPHPRLRMNCNAVQAINGWVIKCDSTHDPVVVVILTFVVFIFVLMSLPFVRRYVVARRSRSRRLVDVNNMEMGNLV